MLFAVSMTPPISHATSTWSINTIDANADSTTYSSELVLDSDNNPHIAYNSYENGNGQGSLNLVYASWNGTNWTTQTVTQNTPVLDLKLDKNNNPHILSYNSGNSYTSEEPLSYISWTSDSNLSTTLLDRDGINGHIAFDSAGNTHIAYTAVARGNNSNNLLKYASLVGSNWSIQTVDAPQTRLNNETDLMLGGSFLVLDSQGNPHILYYYHLTKDGGYSSSLTIKYAVWQGSEWDIQTVVSNALTGSLGNLVLDSHDFPHFVYFTGDDNNAKLMYASWDGSAWKMKTVVSNIYVFSRSYLALDANGNPQIDYLKGNSDFSSGTLMFAAWTGTAWNTQTLDTNAWDAGPIAIDTNGNPHICYTQTPPDTSHYSIAPLMYATTTEPYATSTPTPTQNNTSLYIWIGIPAVTVIVLASLAYAWKSRTKKQNKQNTSPHH